MEVSSWEVIANLVQEGIGVGFIPDYVASRRKATLKKLDLGIKPFPYSLLAIFPKNTSLSKNEEAVLSLFTNY